VEIPTTIATLANMYANATKCWLRIRNNNDNDSRDLRNTAEDDFTA
jgi:hypothetical protein